MDMNKILGHMYDYQKKNNIKAQCITNTQYYSDTFKGNEPEYYSYLGMEVAAAIVVSFDGITATFVNHLVLRAKDIVVDPSWEVASMPETSYFFTIADVKEHVKECSLPIPKIVISRHIHFIGIAKKMNEGECYVANWEFYNAQADYVEKCFG
jgi:hypothetical protein